MAAPFARVDARIDRAELAEGDREFLRARLAELRERYAGLEFVLPAGPVHGAANVGNVIRRANLALAYQDPGRLDEAIPLCRLAVRRNRDSKG